MIKFSILLHRRADLSHEEFVGHHRNVHADLFMSIPAVKANVRRYIQCHGIDAEIPGLPPATYDGITELWFDDVAAIGAVFGDEEYLRVIRPDEASFLDLDATGFLISEEYEVLA